MFFFNYVSYLDFIWNEEILSTCSESDSDFLIIIAESAKKQKQLFLYADREEKTEKSVCNHNLIKVFERKQKHSTIIIIIISETAEFNIHKIIIHSALRLNICDSRF